MPSITFKKGLFSREGHESNIKRFQEPQSLLLTENAGKRILSNDNL